MKKFDIVAGIQFPHRIAQNKTEKEAESWLKNNNYVNVGERQIGLFIFEITAIPIYIYDRRPDLYK